MWPYKLQALVTAVVVLSVFSLAVSYFIVHGDEKTRCFGNCLKRPYASSILHFVYEFNYLKQLRLPSDYAELLQSVLFIGMASSRNNDRVQTLRDTWLTPELRSYLFSDETNTTLGTITLPELANLPTYADAQHRQLRGMQWLLREHPEEIAKSNWVILFDDDTWINPPALASLIAAYDPSEALAIGYVWTDWWYRDASFLSGGAGILLSGAAFAAVAPLLYQEQCPFMGANDVTLCMCLHKAQVLMIHSAKFSHKDTVQTVSYADDSPERPYAPDYVPMVTIHYVKELKKMREFTCNSAKAWNYPTPVTCRKP